MTCFPAQFIRYDYHKELCPSRDGWSKWQKLASRYSTIHEQLNNVYSPTTELLEILGKLATRMPPSTPFRIKFPASRRLSSDTFQTALEFQTTDSPSTQVSNSFTRCCYSSHVWCQFKYTIMSRGLVHVCLCADLVFVSLFLNRRNSGEIGQHTGFLINFLIDRQEVDTGWPEIRGQPVLLVLCEERL